MKLLVLAALLVLISTALFLPEEEEPTLIFPHYVNGEILGKFNKTQVILRSKVDRQETGEIRFLKPDGTSAEVPFENELVGRIAYQIDPNGVISVETDGSGPLERGVIEVYSESGDSSTLEGVEIFSIAEKFVSVNSQSQKSAYQFFVSRTEQENTGFAIYNPNPEPVRIEIALLDASGEHHAYTVLTMRAKEQIAAFVDGVELFAKYFRSRHETDFTGTVSLRVGGGLGVSALSLIQGNQSGALVAVATAQGGLEFDVASQPCPPSLHNRTEWHALIEPEFNCHYDHEHKHDPHEVDDIFGPVAGWFGGNEISYPWETPNENLVKHNGYGWIVRRNVPPGTRTLWVKDFRLQYHGVSAPPGTLTRRHSFSLEARICNVESECGIVRTGGWLDFGNLEVDGEPALLPDQIEAFGDQGRRRIHFFYSDPERRAEGLKAEYFWYGRHIPPELPVGVLHPLSISIASGDVFSNVDPSALEFFNFFCPDFSCGKNGSTIQAHLVRVNIKARFDSDGDGRVNLSAYTDRYGRLRENCDQVGLDCVPLIVENAPIGRADHQDARDLGFPTTGMREFDTAPPGQAWIKYPN